MKWRPPLVTPPPGEHDGESGHGLSLVSSLLMVTCQKPGPGPPGSGRGPVTRVSRDRWGPVTGVCRDPGHPGASLSTGPRTPAAGARCFTGPRQGKFDRAPVLPGPCKEFGPGSGPGCRGRLLCKYSLKESETILEPFVLKPFYRKMAPASIRKSVFPK